MITLALTCPILEATSPISQRSKPSACRAVLYSVLRIQDFLNRQIGHPWQLASKCMMQLAFRCFPKGVLLLSLIHQSIDMPFAFY